jgi:hypothetical protein
MKKLWSVCALVVAGSVAAGAQEADARPDTEIVAEQYLLVGTATRGCGESQVDVAFLPMNLRYTMTPEMVADAAKAFRPKILYPYHFSSTDPLLLVELLKQQKDIEVRIRDLR